MLLFLGTEWLYWRTRSLIPAMILHGAINVPTKGDWDFILPAVMIVALVLFHQKSQGMVREFLKEAAEKGWKRAALGGTVIAVAMVIGFEIWPGVFVPISFLGLAAALLVGFCERRSRRFSA